MKYIKTIFIFVFLASAAIATPRVAYASFNGYTYQRSITIDHTQVPNSDQSSFTVGVIGTYSYLATIGNSGHVQSSSGYDIIFTSDSGCNTKLNWEQAAWSGSNGKVVYWVKLTTVSHTSDTTFYVCYGNSSISSFQGGAAANAWDTGYQAIWHLNDNAANRTVVDSIGLNNGISQNNTSTKVDTTSPFGYGLAFNGSGDYITTGYNSILANFSVEVWYKAASDVSTERLIDKNYANGFWMGHAATGNPSYTNGWGAGILESASPYGTYVIQAKNGWHQLVVDRNSTTKTIYGDGGAENTTATVLSTGTDSTTLSIGKDNSTSNLLTGDMAEVRVSNVHRSNDWYATEYNNINSPSTFYTVGSESTGAAPSYSAVGAKHQIWGGIFKLIGGFFRIQ